MYIQPAQIADDEENNDGNRIKLSIGELINQRHFPKKYLKRAMSRLMNKALLLKEGDLWYLSEQGMLKGKRIVKLHRLWEMYLSTYLKIAPDHVHEDAETIEHIITPELETQLEKLLDYPEVDPHQRKIPY